MVTDNTTRKNYDPGITAVTVGGGLKVNLNGKPIPMKFQSTEAV